MQVTLNRPPSGTSARSFSLSWGLSMINWLGATSMLTWIFLVMGASKAELLTLQMRGNPKLSRDNSRLISLCTLPVPLSCSTRQCHELGSSRTPSCHTTCKSECAVLSHSSFAKSFHVKRELKKVWKNFLYLTAKAFSFFCFWRIEPPFWALGYN